MTNNVLYYPFIRVPNNDWFTRVLLYWDSVGSIVPYEFIRNPDQLGPHMQSLLTEELVKQVIPGFYIHKAPNFTDAFLRLAEEFKAKNKLNEDALASLPTFNVHIEKLDDIGDELCKIGLAKRTSYSWYEIESRLAQIFMAYLAGVLSNIPEVDSRPITDTSDQLGLYESPDKLRTFLLDDLLPAPTGGVVVSELSRFKLKHNKPLIKFRSHIESFMIQGGSIEGVSKREQMVAHFLADAKVEIENIVDAMKSQGWKKISMGRFLSYSATGVALIDAIATGGLLATIAAAFYTGASVYTTYRETRLPEAFQNSFVAYAALATKL